jgi:hypothetical protein
MNIAATIVDPADAALPWLASLSSDERPMNEVIRPDRAACRLTALAFLRLAGLALAAVLASPAATAQDDIAALQGTNIVYAGLFEPLDCPFGRRFDCMTWPANVLRTKDGRACFATSAAESCRGVCQGVLAADKGHHVSVFVLDRGGVTQGDLRPVHCPGTL